MLPPGETKQRLEDTGCPQTPCVCNQTHGVPIIGKRECLERAQRTRDNGQLTSPEGTHLSIARVTVELLFLHIERKKPGEVV